MECSRLALYGGQPVRSNQLPYGRQSVDEADISAVNQVLRSQWLTTGPNVSEFEDVFAQETGAKHAVAVSSGTAALHAAVYAAGISYGDEVIVPTMTFAATANCVVYQGGTPVFADVSPDTLLLEAVDAERHLTPNTRAMIVVDYAGQPCNYADLVSLAKANNLTLISDSCHSLGGSYHGDPVGTLADMSTFSFHPVKHITTAEGGMVTTDREDLAHSMRRFRNHGINSDHRQRDMEGSWFYEMVDLGYNYRISDMQCVLGISQLKKLRQSVIRRREIANYYDEALSNMQGINPLEVNINLVHAYHLYVIRIDESILGLNRAQIFRGLRAEGIGVNVHYVPVHLHPYYRKKFFTKEGDHPLAESAYSQILSLPMFPTMNQNDCIDVVKAVSKVSDIVNWEGETMIKP